MSSRFIRLSLLLCVTLTLANAWQPAAAQTKTGDLADSREAIRFASFNVALNRPNAGDLVTELQSNDSAKVQEIAEVIQRVRPDVMLVNEIDYDEQGRSVTLFQENYLSVGQNGQEPIEYPHVYVAPVNTGVPSGVDINQDGKVETPDDAYGFGRFPGQYGMAVLSKYPIQEDEIRTFQDFLWKDMPDAMVPMKPATDEPYYPADVWEQLRLSSKSHWDVPIRIGDKTVHLIAAHPTPPVFDGPEDRNGRRNHDEIRMIADYISDQADYLYDDQGQRGGLDRSEPFVVAGDMNADPFDGDSADQAARLLAEHPRINTGCVPSSRGAVEAARCSGQKNESHQGDPAYDTGDFNDESVGNIRVDYCLPSDDFELVDCGVFWPTKGEPGYELNDASDHHLVWIDVRFKE